MGKERGDINKYSPLSDSIGLFYSKEKSTLLLSTNFTFNSNSS